MANYNVNVEGEGKQKVFFPPIRKPDEIITASDNVKNMIMTPGWQELENYIRGDLAQAKGVVESEQDIFKVRFEQGKIAAIRQILALPQAFEVAGEQARKLKGKSNGR